MPYVILFFVVAGLIMLALKYWYIVVGVIAVIALAIWLPGAIRRMRRDAYFASEEFKAHKAAIADLVKEHNDIAEYAAELRNTHEFTLGASSTGKYAGLAEFRNTSSHNYRRDRNKANYDADNVYNCSLQVVRNAKRDPLKYLMKYFDIEATQERLAAVERLGETISRLEGAIENLKKREFEVSQSIKPPLFIITYYRDEFYSEIGFELKEIEVPYQRYRFEYVSAGGNSSQTTDIVLNGETIDALIEVMSTKIKFLKSAAGQRALMTQKLRTAIKERDDYTCQICNLSVRDEPNLLLEIDHIIPIARGGLSTEDNLQTLCWRCNRHKGTKLLES
ncbi:HNH endonuclease [Actinobaculum massiliense]|uniref:HNH endonuclease n=1 Tax=Actinobaculum massiliense TaxID=202789 RepID=UPI0009EB71B6|nr:HNH endonuclease signature motif containing protein [Actinobaculum massiliense]